MRTAILDADEVLLSFVDPFLREVERRTGIRRTVDDILGWDMSAFYPEEHRGIVRQTLRDVVHDPEFVRRQLPLGDAVAAVRHLVGNGWRLFVLTAIGTSPGVVGARTECLLGHFGPDAFEDIHFVDRAEEKPEVLRRIGAAVFVDDHPETVLNSTVATMVFDRPWNRDIPVPVRRIRSLGELAAPDTA